MSNHSAVRMAENEATFRRANERIGEFARELEFPDPIPFLCECGEERCREILRLSRRDYEEVRAEPTHFFVVPGHQNVGGASARVVRDGEGHVVVEKIGAAGEVARAEDSRAAEMPRQAGAE